MIFCLPRPIAHHFNENSATSSGLSRVDFDSVIAQDSARRTGPGWSEARGLWYPSMNALDQSLISLQIYPVTGIVVVRSKSLYYLPESDKLSTTFSSFHYKYKFVLFLPWKIKDTVSFYLMSGDSEYGTRSHLSKYQSNLQSYLQFYSRARRQVMKTDSVSPTWRFCQPKKHQMPIAPRRFHTTGVESSLGLYGRDSCRFAREYEGTSEPAGMVPFFFPLKRYDFLFPSICCPSLHRGQR